MTTERKIILWLYACCFMVFAMAVIGAITRLTESGLSMVEWRPLIGWVPPLNEQDWQHVYGLYKQSPEFIHKHHWMALADFKKIFFWEWLHRLWGRLIGLVYALPLLWFWANKQIRPGYSWKFFGLLLLGGAQGILGWWMVKSGLVDRPEVSHFRLAAHLALALLLFSLLWWIALGLKTNKSSGRLSVHGLLSLILLSATILWGAFTAGLDAGLIYNSFPLMDNSFTPAGQASLSSMVHEQGWVQFTHRWLAVTAGLVIIGFAARMKDFALAGMVIIQIGLGIATLLTQVFIPLAALHQAGALILLALLLRALHKQCH